MPCLLLLTIEKHSDSSPLKLKFSLYKDQVNQCLTWKNSTAEFAQEARKGICFKK